MVSKSTKRKWRKNKERIEKRKSVSLRLIDKRVDFWLISSPSVNKNVVRHYERYGRAKALRFCRKVISLI